MAGGDDPLSLNFMYGSKPKPKPPEPGQKDFEPPPVPKKFPPRTDVRKPLHHEEGDVDEDDADNDRDPDMLPPSLQERRAVPEDEAIVMEELDEWDRGLFLLDLGIDRMVDAVNDDVLPALRKLAAMAAEDDGFRVNEIAEIFVEGVLPYLTQMDVKLAELIGEAPDEDA